MDRCWRSNLRVDSSVLWTQKLHKSYRTRFKGNWWNLTSWRLPLRSCGFFSMLLASACHATLPSLWRSSLIWVGLKQLHLIVPWRIANSYLWHVNPHSRIRRATFKNCLLHSASFCYISAIFSLKFQETSPSTAFPWRHRSPFCLVSAWKSWSRRPAGQVRANSSAGPGTQSL